MVKRVDPLRPRPTFRKSPAALVERFRAELATRARVPLPPAGESLTPSWWPSAWTTWVPPATASQNRRMAPIVASARTEWNTSKACGAPGSSR